jgi:hypothetical protein
VLWSVFTLNCAILTIPKHKTIVAEEQLGTSSVKKEKRGVFANGYAPHYDDWTHLPHSHPHHHSSHGIPPPVFPPHPPVTLGQHFHTTVTKKLGYPIPYPVSYFEKYLKLKKEQTFSITQNDKYMMCRYQRDGKQIGLFMNILIT